MRLDEKAGGQRGKGRDDYPIRPVWIRLGGDCVSARECGIAAEGAFANGELREGCGLIP